MPPKKATKKQLSDNIIENITVENIAEDVKDSPSIVTDNINLEQIGDIIDKILADKLEAFSRDIDEKLRKLINDMPKNQGETTTCDHINITIQPGATINYTNNGRQNMHDNTKPHRGGFGAHGKF